MSEMQIALKPLDIQNELHLKLMFEVRTHPDVASKLSSAPPKDYEQHVQYLTKIATNKMFFIITADQVSCGYCHITFRENEAELGWALHPAWWGKKIGSASVKLLVEHVKREYTASTSNVPVWLRQSPRGSIDRKSPNISNMRRLAIALTAGAFTHPDGYV